MFWWKRPDSSWTLPGCGCVGPGEFVFCAKTTQLGDVVKLWSTRTESREVCGTSCACSKGQKMQDIKAARNARQNDWAGRSGVACGSVPRRCPPHANDTTVTTFTVWQAALAVPVRWRLCSSWACSFSIPPLILEMGRRIVCPCVQGLSSPVGWGSCRYQDRRVAPTQHFPLPETGVFSM